MHMMRRLKSIASGRSSVSDPGDLDINRAKFNQDGSGDIAIEPHLLEDKSMCADQEHSSSHIDIEASTSNADPPARTQETSADCLPKEMSDMTIHGDKIDYHNDKEMEGTVVHGHGTETGQVIVTTIGGQNEKSKQVSYMSDRVVGTGSFGVVFQAKCLETGETVAIKKEGEVFLNIVLEYVSETVYSVAKYYNQMNQRVPIIQAQLYTYQMCRALAYLHRIVGVCHCDIKPHNLLVNSHRHQVKICDFGSAKKSLEACAHPFFDDLRDPKACLPNGRPLPPLFNFTAAGAPLELVHRIIPEHRRK